MPRHHHRPTPWQTPRPRRHRPHRYSIAHLSDADLSDANTKVVISAQPTAGSAPISLLAASTKGSDRTTVVLTASGPGTPLGLLPASSCAFDSVLDLDITIAEPSPFRGSDESTLVDGPTTPEKPLRRSSTTAPDDSNLAAGQRPRRKSFIDAFQALRPKSAHLSSWIHQVRQTPASSTTSTPSSTAPKRRTLFGRVTSAAPWQLLFLPAFTSSSTSIPSSSYLDEDELPSKPSSTPTMAPPPQAAHAQLDVLSVDVNFVRPYAYDDMSLSAQASPADTTVSLVNAPWVSSRPAGRADVPLPQPLPALPRTASKRFETVDVATPLLLAAEPKPRARSASASEAVPAKMRRPSGTPRKLMNFFGETPPGDVPLATITASGLPAMLNARLPLCYFLAALLEDYASENLFFVLEVERYEASPFSDPHAHLRAAFAVFETYLGRGSQLEVNVAGRARQTVLTEITRLAAAGRTGHHGDAAGLRNVFAPAKTAVLALLDASYTKFARSPRFEQMHRDLGDAETYSAEARKAALAVLAEYLKRNGVLEEASVEPAQHAGATAGGADFLGGDRAGKR
ncbi:hypothetical protein AMAG_16293 [Allomyces macrogynus ATCC 38327]|uniref:RGS domain-containing protein n=1 Tax=Allomyces macrogynus (strain ATCC 38327) TaxID=578462 RepID=A0A0L0TAT3_ALLM3|nr:hypothetical protein AMAG_16293 [Allomyces macrogynus ATCC 38327]|eukprot:KNE71862.1 hypothetical protein AMAG_16293 [Allomyces macrogynus ATCC 38327]